jgi:hypothetical protein
MKLKPSFLAVPGALALVAALALALPALSSGGADGRKVLSSAVLAPVTGPYVGPTNPIRGVAGGGLPWRLASGSVELRADGRLHVDVEGLVFAAGPNEGTNTFAAFKAIVSCQSVDNGAAVVSNVPTELFAASTAGDAELDTTISLPSPCVAPIVFVTAPGGAWFAATGA